MSVVTIMSGSFCGGEEVAQGVAASLGGKLFRDEDLIALAAKMGRLSASAIRRAMYGRPSIFNQFSHERERAASRLKLAMAGLLVEEESMVYLGLGSQLTGATISHVLRACLIADTGHRAVMAARELGLGPKESQARIHRDDESAIRWAEFLHGADPWDADRYDILLPMDKQSLAEAVGKICEHAASPGLSPGDSSRGAAADYFLAAKVENSLASQGHTMRDIAVSAAEGLVTIEVNKKVVRLNKLSAELEAIARKVDGVADVQVKAGPKFHQADLYLGVDFELPSKVLLVDDEREFAETLSRRLMLRQIGSAVVYDGASALETVAEDEPEVLVLDLKMPGVDGYEVLRRIKRDYPKVEVIILTGHGSAKDEEACMQLGAFAYLEKPVDVDLLAETMQRAYRKLNGANS